MLDPVHLTSSANPRVKHVLRLRQGRYRRRAGLFVAEGCRQIGRALDAGLRLVDLLWSPTLLGDRAAEVARLRRQAEGGADSAGVYTVEPAVFGRMAYRRNPEGVLAVFESRQWALPAVLSVAGDGPGLWLVAVGLEKPGNLGALARSLAAAGGSGMLLADTVVDPMHPNALDASTGAVLSLPIATAATDEIIRRYEVDALETQIETFRMLRQSVTTPYVARALLEKGFALVDDATAADNKALALQVAEDAIAVAKKSDDNELFKRAVMRFVNLQESP